MQTKRKYQAFLELLKVLIHPFHPLFLTLFHTLFRDRSRSVLLRQFKHWHHTVYGNQLYRIDGAVAVSPYLQLQLQHQDCIVEIQCWHRVTYLLEERGC